jgi:hypothetical protein
MRPAIVLFAAALLLAGCGSDESTTTPAETAPSTETGPTAGASSAPVGAAAHECGSVGGLTKVRAVGVACDEARQIAAAWDVPRCRPAAGGSRSACTVRRYRCQGVVTDRGLSVSCSRPGQSISFLRPR